MLDPSDYLDLSVEPPHPLPNEIDDAVRYLSAVLGLPVYQTWTPAKLLERYGSMPAAKAAQPEVFALMLSGISVVQFWDLGQISTRDAALAPSAEAVVARLLRTLKVRFRPVQATPALRESATKAAGAAAIRPDLHPVRRSLADDPWLARTGRFYNPDPATNTLAVSCDGAAVQRFLQERASSSPHTLRAYTYELRKLIRWCGKHSFMAVVKA